jgi:hypothetical protein
MFRPQEEVFIRSLTSVRYAYGGFLATLEMTNSTQSEVPLLNLLNKIFLFVVPAK